MTTAYPGGIDNVYAKAILSSDGTAPADGDTVTVHDQTYRFKGTMAQANDVKLEATSDATLDHFVKAINQSGVAGTDYFAGTVAPTDVTSANRSGTGASATVTLTASTYGTGPNSYASTETSAHLSFGGTTFSGGLFNLKNDANDATPTSGTHPTGHNNVSDAVIAIETVLGINPAGSYGTIANAIATVGGAAVLLAPSADQVVLPTADKINLALRAYNSAQTSKVQEWRNASNTVVAYVDKSGNLSAASLNISGTALAASHLSNGTTGTGAVVLADSPALTTNPTAPTQAVDNSSTRIATTAYVIGQASASGDGNPAMDGTAQRGTSTHWARADHIHPTDTSRAALASPTFTGDPKAPTPSPGDNDTSIATTAFVTNALSGVTSTRTAMFPIDLRVAQQNANQGNAFPEVYAMTSYEMMWWEFLKDVDGHIYGIVRVPENLAGTPNAKVVLEIMANATSGVTTLGLSTKNVANAGSMDPGSLTAETDQDITVPATAYLRKKVTFTLTTAPAAQDLLIVDVFHHGTAVNDTLAVDTLLLGAWLICDVT